MLKGITANVQLYKVTKETVDLTQSSIKSDSRFKSYLDRA